MIPAEKEALLTGPVVVALGTVMPNGYPQLTPVWCSYQDGLIWLNTAEGRQKDKNLQANPKVTVLAVDPADPYNWIEVRGSVVERTHEGAVEHISQLAQLYAGAKSYYGDFAPAERAQQETRVIYKIKPEKVTPVK